MAFLDIAPLAEGHLLLVPLEHYRRLDDMRPELVASVCSRLAELGSAVVRVTGAQGYNVLQNNGRVAGQVVEHVHFHVIPRKADDGLGYRWLAKSYAPGRDEQLRDLLRGALGG
jgi:histidine triad (HIT) family protein